MSRAGDANARAARLPGQRRVGSLPSANRCGAARFLHARRAQAAPGGGERQPTRFRSISTVGTGACRRQNRQMHSPPPPSIPPGLALALALALLATSSAHATNPGASITCPPTLVETPVVSSLSAGWEIDVHAGRRTLSDAAVHVSRGSDRGGVPPDATTRSGRHESAWWTLSPGDGSVYWVACSYGNTSALLLQRIPDTARRCTATHEVLESGRHLNVQPVRCE